MFEFPSYLATTLLVSPADFRVDALTGGLTNVTVRATFSNPISSFNSSPPFTTAVLKHAPPYIAADPSQPMSVHRQVIEANALRYLAETPAIRDLFALEFPRLRIPRLIHHDTTANVLWITDLGESQTLSKFLATSPSDAREIAVTLGTFAARLWEITAHPAPETLALFAHTDGEGAPVDFLVSVALGVMVKGGVPDAEVLSARIRTAMEAKEKFEPCLSMVDFWPESFLIGVDESLGLVDWEYFGLSTPGAEIGMLGEKHLFQ
ncbi:kinase-like domain-containing protein [Mycena alexandri]|uniref:Kinase-like domain-containing protein n=1 Tax=Mycena alexandri TaxID=1745969 RepID=A0AAD6TB45_9AGAR|nr:kinase-like domain-containing protein [Mycena alexandri]